MFGLGWWGTSVAGLVIDAVGFSILAWDLIPSYLQDRAELAHARATEQAQGHLDSISRGASLIRIWRVVIRRRQREMERQSFAWQANYLLGLGIKIAFPRIGFWHVRALIRAYDHSSRYGQDVQELLAFNRNLAAIRQVVPRSVRAQHPFSFAEVKAKGHPIPVSIGDLHELILSARRRMAAKARPPLRWGIMLVICGFILQAWGTWGGVPDV